MLRLAHLGSCAPRLASREQRRSHHPPSVHTGALSAPMLEKLSAAMRKYAVPLPAGPVTLPPTVPAVLHPLPKSPRVIAPFMLAHSFAHHSVDLHSMPHAATSAPKPDSWTPVTPAHTVRPLRVTNSGLSSYLARVHMTTGLSASGILALSYALTSLVALPAGWMAPVWLAAVAIVRRSSRALTTSTQEHLQPSERRRRDLQLYTVNAWQRKVALAVFTASAAVTITPLVGLVGLLQPWAVPVAIGTTLSSALVSSIYSSRKRRNASFLVWQAPLVGASVTMASMGALGAGAMLVGVAPQLATILLAPEAHALTLALGVLFAADSSAAAMEYRRGEADHLAHAATVYTHAATLMVNIVRYLLKWPIPLSYETRNGGPRKANMPALLTAGR